MQGFVLKGKANTCEDKTRLRRTGTIIRYLEWKETKNELQLLRPTVSYVQSPQNTYAQ